MLLAEDSHDVLTVVSSPPADQFQAIQSRLTLAELQQRSYEGEQLAIARATPGVLMPLVHCVSSGTVAVGDRKARGGSPAEDEAVFAGYDFPGNLERSRRSELARYSPIYIRRSLDGWRGASNHLADAQYQGGPRFHLHGSIAPLDSLEPSLRRYRSRLDRGCLPGPWWKFAGRPLGSFGDVSVLSFGGSKLLSAGRGGAVLTSDPRLAQRITILNDRATWPIR
ncbi:MAG: DegT/DnrJ/EryC1/StrS family aminotransferase [Pirellulaceae bacterium]